MRFVCGAIGARGGLTIQALVTARGPRFSRGLHEMPLVPFYRLF
ncbi:unnamed protein product [Staurois parvus]|uniref:Uncharacterized protein n=1 Tax=Staurois parvus TaxID=386267 RepID=A0ABN9FS05_9NEOB|nr:unnamed protein product [Staurois parvus]